MKIDKIIVIDNDDFVENFIWKDKICVDGFWVPNVPADGVYLYSDINANVVDTAAFKDGKRLHCSPNLGENGNSFTEEQMDDFKGLNFFVGDKFHAKRFTQSQTEGGPGPDKSQWD